MHPLLRPATRVCVALAVCAAMAWAGYAALNRPRAPAALDYVVLDGSKHTTADWSGQVMLVNFWAPSCAPCREEMPHWADLYQRYRGQGLGLLAVAVRSDPPAWVVDYVQAQRLPFPVALDLQGQLAAGFAQTEATPTTFLLNRRGEIVQHIVGPADFTRLVPQIERLLTTP